MKNKIIALLNDIAVKENITILYACESGSRAWGFPSTDSDYDVRFVYVRKQNAYLNIRKTDDQLSYPITDDLDIYGWDLKKFLQLLHKSNCTPFEWLQSPVVYMKNDAFYIEVVAVLPTYFNDAQQLYHYKGIAYGSLKDATIDTIGIKKLFYVIRPLLAALWIVMYKQYPPMHMAGLLKPVSTDLKTTINDLIAQKSIAGEKEVLTIDETIKAFISECFITLDAARVTCKPNDITEPLNQIFRKWITI